MAISKIWVFAEADGDTPATSTLELLTKARDLGGTLEAVYVGANGDALAAGLGEHGATTVYAVDPGDVLPGVVGAATLAALIAEHSPDVVLFAQSYDGHDASRAPVGAARPPRAHQRHCAAGRQRQARGRHRDLRWQHAGRHGVRRRRSVPRSDSSEVVRGRGLGRRRGRGRDRAGR